jgi:hypothetical protein
MPALRFLIGISILIGVFFTFIFSSFWAIIFLFKHDLRFLQTDFPIDAIVNSNEFIISATSLYFIGLVLMAFFFVIAISIIGKKMFLNLKTTAILIALLIVNTTIFSVYCFELAATVKMTYDKYISENMTEKTIDIKDFNAISGEMRGRIKIEQADIFSVSLKGLKKDVDNIQFTLDTASSSEIVNLLIERKNKNINHKVFNIYEPLELTVKMPVLKQFDPSGFWGYDLKGFENEGEILADYLYDRHGRDRVLQKDLCELNGEYWCEASQRCIKPWMELCEAGTNPE